LFNHIGYQPTYAAPQTAWLFDHFVSAWLTIPAELWLGGFCLSPARKMPTKLSRVVRSGVNSEESRNQDDDDHDADDVEDVHLCTPIEVHIFNAKIRPSIGNAVARAQVPHEQSLQHHTK
jgi:hypothetical protein